MAGGSKEASTPFISAQAQQEAVSEGIEAFELPRSIITKLARAAMSENTKMSKDVVLSFQKASTVFINYLAATAHEVATSKQHKSISASDVLRALELVEMGDMVPNLQQELHAYREIQKADKGRKGAGGAKGKGRESQAEPPSISATSSATKAKTKGKEKGPTITINRSQVRAPPQSEPEPEDAEGEPVVNGDGDGDEVADGEEVEDEDEAQDEDEDEGDEELEDPMVVDDEEERTDASSLDEADEAE